MDIVSTSRPGGERLSLFQEPVPANVPAVGLETGASRVYASGLRNPNGLTIHPDTGTLWTVVNERDELGPNLVPDYMTSVQDAGFYGWPWSYFGDHVDIRVHPPRPDMVEQAIVPDYALSTHVAPLRTKWPIHRKRRSHRPLIRRISESADRGEMTKRKTPASSARVRKDIDRGKSGDKVDLPDPAAAPLGTDDGAGLASAAGHMTCYGFVPEQEQPQATRVGGRGRGHSD